LKSPGFKNREKPEKKLRRVCERQKHVAHEGEIASKTWKKLPGKRSNQPWRGKKKKRHTPSAGKKRRGGAGRRGSPLKGILTRGLSELKKGTEKDEERGREKTKKPRQKSKKQGQTK